MAELSFSALLVCTLALVQISHGCTRPFPVPIPITDEPTAPSSSATSSPATDPSTSSSTYQTTSAGDMDDATTTHPSTTSMPSPATDPASTYDPSTDGLTSSSTEQTTSAGTDDATTNGTVTPLPHCCDGKPGRTTAPTQWPASQSTAGGPAGNPQAAVCIFYRQSNCLVCRKGAMISKCCTAIPCEKNDTKYGGPTPYNEYLIGQWRNHPTHNIGWYNLYPRKEAPLAGYYGYNQPTATGRSAMGLHPGTMTLGCATVIDNDNCWAETEKVLNSGNMMYNGSGYSGFLYVIPA